MKQNQPVTGHLATFSNSLVFVSPAIGLLKLKLTPGTAAEAAANEAAILSELPPARELASRLAQL